MPFAVRRAGNALESWLDVWFRVLCDSDKLASQVAASLSNNIRGGLVGDLLAHEVSSAHGCELTCRAVKGSLKGRVCSFPSKNSDTCHDGFNTAGNSFSS